VGVAKRGQTHIAAAPSTSRAALSKVFLVLFLQKKNALLNSLNRE
jgi:hypothetical protein